MNDKWERPTRAREEAIIIDDRAGDIEEAQYRREVAHAYRMAAKLAARDRMPYCVVEFEVEDANGLVVRFTDAIPDKELKGFQESVRNSRPKGEVKVVSTFGVGFTGGQGIATPPPAPAAAGDEPSGRLSPNGDGIQKSEPVPQALPGLGRRRRARRPRDGSAVSLAIKVLRRAGATMNIDELYKSIQKEGFESKAKDPQISVAQQLYKSPYITAEKGQFGLPEWEEELVREGN